MNRNKDLAKHGLDKTFLSILERLLSEQKTFIGYTHMTCVDEERAYTDTFNMHPCYHNVPWYDWAYVYYVNEEDDESKDKFTLQKSWDS